MAQFVAFDSHVEVSGQSMLITIEAMGDAVRPILKEFGFSRLDPNQWYPQQPYLDFFHNVASGDFQSILDLVNIGTKVPSLAYWPPEVQNIMDALNSINVAYGMNHRNGEIGFYETAQVGEREVKIRAANPYPCDFDYGLIYGTARMYLPRGGRLDVEHLAGECRKHNGEACTYSVSW